MVVKDFEFTDGAMGGMNLEGAIVGGEGERRFEGF